MPPTKEEVSQAFAKADKDENGKLTIKEFADIMLELAEDDEDRKLAENDSSLEMIMGMVDADGDKMVSLEELLRLLEIGNTDDEDGKELAINMIKAADKDGNGYLTAGELKELLMKMDPQDEEDMDETVAMFIKMGSANGDKKLKVEEAIKLFTADPKKEDPKERFKTMFRMCDCDGNGVVSKKELSTFMSSMGGDDDDDKSTSRMIIGMMMSMHDEDEDGVLNFHEFCKMMDDK